MSTTIQDGTGTKLKVKVNEDNRLLGQSIIETEFDNAVGKGEAYNINTEFLTATSSVEIPLLYVKNEEDRDLILSAWFIGTDADSGTATRQSLLRVYTNPTGGTIISAGTDVTPVNRKVGSNNQLQVTAKKGGDGFTFTGNNATPLLYQTQATKSRAFGIIQVCIQKAGSVVVTYQQYGLTSNDIYTGFQVYLSDTK